MKKLIFPLAFLCYFLFSNIALADVDNCFSKENAELLAKKAVKQYIISYCDCCAEVGNAMPAVLLYVKNTSVVQCDFDNTQFSVQMEYDIVGEFNVNKGKLDTKSFAPVGTTTTQIMNTISLNYHFFIKKRKANRLYDMIGAKNPSSKCWALDIFPSAKDTNNDPNYAKWLKSQK